MPEVTPLAVTAPVGSTIIVLVVYALVGIPIVFWGLTRTDKRGLAWVFLPVLAAVTSAGLWFYIDQQVHP